MLIGGALTTLGVLSLCRLCAVSANLRAGLR
jgi:hypothetical protein